MKKKKFPFVNCTEKELRFMEKHYFLTMGGDFVSDDNHVYMFTENEMAKLYNKQIDYIAELLDDEDKKQRDFANHLMTTLRIIPVRIH